MRIVREGEQPSKQEKRPYLYYEALRAILHVGKITAFWLGGILVPTSAVAGVLAAISDEAKAIMAARINRPIHLYRRLRAAYNAEDTPIVTPKILEKHSDAPTITSSGTKKSPRLRVSSSNTKHSRKTQVSTKLPPTDNVPSSQLHTEDEVSALFLAVSTLNKSLQFPLDSAATIAEQKGRTFFNQALYHSDTRNIDARHKLLVQSYREYRLALGK